MPESPVPYQRLPHRQLQLICHVVVACFVLLITSPLAPVQASASSNISVTTISDTVDGDVSSFATLAVAPGTDGRISLREAMLAARTTNDGSTLTISFDLPTVQANGAVWTIQLDPNKQSLPTLNRGNVTIDASSQIASGGQVIINGGNTNQIGDGITITSANNLLRGLTITNLFNQGITLRDKAANNQIDSCVITENHANGILLDGSNVQNNRITHSEISANTTAGIDIGGGATNTQIGGTRSEGNLIRANGVLGIYIHDATTSGTIIRSNSIRDHVPPDDSNETYGIYVTGNAHDTQIGGSDAETGNQIGNNQNGILVDASSNTTIAGNAIGVEADGITAAPNQNYGILLLYGATTITIGGSEPAARNIISANGKTGVYMFDSPANTVENNYIGLAGDGQTLRGNGQYGVVISGNSTKNIIDQNTIIANGIGNIRVDASSNTITKNQIGITASGQQPSFNQGSGILITGNNNTVGPANVIAQHQQFGIDAIGSDLLVRGNTIDNNQQAGITIRADFAVVNNNTISNNGTPNAPTAAGVALINANNATISDNTIAQNNAPGVLVDVGSNNTVQSNVISNNKGPGIKLQSGGNEQIAAPTIRAVTSTSIEGQACAGCIVEVFSDDGDEGRILLGQTNSTTDGSFSFAMSARMLVNANVTATATDNVGNTSQFAEPFAVPLDISPRAARTYVPLLTKN